MSHMSTISIANGKRFLFAIGSSIIVFVLIIVIGGLTLPNNEIAWKALGVFDALTCSAILAAWFPGVNTFNKPSMKIIIIALIVAVGFNYINHLVGNIVSEKQYINEFNSFNVYGRVLYILIVCLFAPISEEIYFRGLLFPIVSLRLGAPVGAILSAILFVLAHMSFDVVFMTIVYTCLVYRSKSVFTSMFAHISYNTIWMIRVLILHS